MINTTKSIKEQLQSLLERNLVDESFVEDVRDALLLVDDDDYRLDNIDDVPELFEGTLEALESLDIDVKKMRAGTYNKQ
tara:strand:+ start:207 stop:443 length:237 start_codon:yes stop_codon:yes gene_type:complete